MGLSYLGGKSWLDVTREERLFCAHLYHDIKSGGRERELVGWLMDKAIWHPQSAREALDVNQDWEVAYEVCFYRDLLHSAGEPVRASDYPSKRTFDLCLFSEKCVVIVEAKVHERFGKEQVEAIREDKKRVGRIAMHVARNDKKPVVMTIGLASSTYFKNVFKRGHVLAPLIESAFDARVTWHSVYELLGDPLYEDADEKYPGSRANGVLAEPQSGALKRR